VSRQQAPRVRRAASAVSDGYGGGLGWGLPGIPPP
jgi:hypothetical protein